jgi:NADH:ubiquinone reductase (H+-translocating)
MNGKGPNRVVIVGAGFGGLNAAQALGNAPVSITVIDRQNHHTFQPLLYQVATAGLSPGEIAAPIRSILHRHKNIEVLMAEVTGFDLERRVVRIAAQSAEAKCDDVRNHDAQDYLENPAQEIPYDYLIVAAGASHAYFGHDEWENLAPGLKTVEDALEIRRRVLLAFELAERRAAAGEGSDPLNFVVVGGGPTGVELAGTLAEICRHALAQDFRSIDPRRARIHLLEGGPHVLPAYPEDLSRSALEQLQRLGVEVLTSTMVTNVEPGLVYMRTTNGEKKMNAAVTLWAAGVAASPLGKKLGVPIDRAGRVLVNPDLSLPGHPEVFVIGDLAALKDASSNLLPGVAPVALQEGKFAAKLIRRETELAGTATRPEAVPRPAFHYLDKGSLATIGRSAAIAQFGRIHISGFIAWLAWLFVHIFFLIGFRNRILVFIQWAWSYFTYERGARLITGSTNLPGWNDPRALNAAEDEPEEMSAVIRK